MKLSKIAAALSLAAIVATPAFAVPTITNTDGVLQPFGGFDWAGGSAAYSNDFTAAATAGAGSIFHVTYAGWASNLTCSTGASCTTLITPKLDTNANGVSGGASFYEYTNLTNLTIKITSISPDGSVIAYQVQGGTFDIRYDTTPDAHAVAGGNWTGFTDGVSIITGTYSSTPGGYLTVLGTNSIGLAGTVNYTDTTFVNPALAGTTISSTLQLFGFDSTSFNAPTSIEGTAITDILFQADANQTFTAVPEPAGLLLVGAALAGLGFTSRRRRQD